MSANPKKSLSPTEGGEPTRISLPLLSDAASWQQTLLHRTAIAARLLLCTAVTAVLGYSQVSKAVVAYYPSWHSTTNLQTLYNAGALAKVTYLIYAFGDIDSSGNCYLNSADSTLNAALQQTYTAATSIDGVADTGSATALQGDFNQLRKLKKLLAAQGVTLKILVSIGGESYSNTGYFSSASAATIASTCNNFLTGHFENVYPAGYSGTKVAYSSANAGIIDGIDLDWETIENSSDGTQFSSILHDLRTTLASNAVVTAAIGPENGGNPGYGNITFTGTTGPTNSVNFFNVMAYNYAGNWNGTVSSNAPLAPNYPNTNTIESNISELMSYGTIPGNKIVLGIPLYGVHWSGLTYPSGTSLSTLETWSGPIATTDTAYSAIPAVPQADTHYDTSSSMTWGKWGYDAVNGNLWNYDDPQTILEKDSYVNASLGGMMAWDLSQDTPNGALTCAMETGISGSNSCGLRFVPVTPCRLVDTRQTSPIGANATEDFPILSLANASGSACREAGNAIPANAQAYSLNVTVVPSGTLNWLTLYPAGQSQPNSSTINSDGRIKATAAIVPAGSGGDVMAYATNQTNLILDLNGYFVAAVNDTTGLEFYPITPCRILDTRPSNTFAAGETRNVPVQGVCGVPASAKSYSLNYTVIPKKTLGWLTTWPAGESMPTVSTLNDPTGTTVANAAIVPAASSNGAVSVYTTDATDVVIDVNGYFAAPASSGLSMYSLQPCRVLDTRLKAGGFSGTQTENIVGTSCNVSSTAKAYVFNATVVPQSSLGWLTLWPDNGASAPNASTLNATDEAVTSNMALIPTTNGEVNAYASSQTQLILDISGYFAP